ncbi:DUF3168 domain-containing protein [Collimonas humicola]|uniref:DUF3168 domain-containing protein n=1 Tax=Collimonas humicola TaxID=2825886 RepID=UPI001B8AF534|nr:DUF3168 domain-containing protein [Collimonas humicola]
MIEKQIWTAIKSLFVGGVHYDVAPDSRTLPYATLQQVGGASVNDLDGPDTLENPRIQIDVFAKTRLEANELLKAAGAVLCSGPLKGVPLGAPISTYNDDLKIYRRSQDFSFWL